MRVYEGILCAVSIVTIFYSLFNLRKKDNKNYYILIVLIPILIAHLIFEGIRWQMFGIYIYSLYLVYRGLFVRNKRFSIGEPGEKKLPAIVMTLIVVISILLTILFQVNDMPKPRGAYKIGTVSYDIVDENRVELYGNRKGEARKFRAQFWYPSDDISEGKQTKWMSDGLAVARQVPPQIGLPSFLLDYTGLIKSNSYEGVAISEKEDKYPLVILSHGWTGYRQLHSDMAELLASHGYIVVSIDHTYGSLATVFEDGELALLDKDALPNREDTENYLDYAKDLVNTYAYDSRRTIDFIEDLNKTKLFDNKIDMERIGALGHSTGGGGVVKLAMEDSRLKAVLGLDPWIEPLGHEELAQGLNIPSLFIRSEQWEVGYNNAYISTLVANSKIKPLTYQIQGTKHQDFTMLYMYRPIYDLAGFSGDLNSQLSLDIRLDYVLEFFDEYLMDKSVKVEDLVNKYEAVMSVEY